MAYQTYTTEALVCGSKNNNTSDRAYLLFTKEAGMLWATARSVREERSKQRFALQEFSFIRVSLVKGKSGWRIGSVEALSNPFLGACDRKERAHVKNLVTVLRRYIQGEQPMVRIFSDTREALGAATLGYDLDTINLLFTVRLLHELGYISKNATTEPVFAAATLTAALEGCDGEGIEVAELTQLVERAHTLSHL